MVARGLIESAALTDDDLIAGGISASTARRLLHGKMRSINSATVERLNAIIRMLPPEQAVDPIETTVPVEPTINTQAVYDARCRRPPASGWCLGPTHIEYPPDPPWVEGTYLDRPLA